MRLSEVAMKRRVDATGGEEGEGLKEVRGARN